MKASAQWVTNTDSGNLCKDYICQVVFPPNMSLKFTALEARVNTLERPKASEYSPRPSKRTREHQQTPNSDNRLLGGCAWILEALRSESLRIISPTSHMSDHRAVVFSRLAEKRRSAPRDMAHTRSARAKKRAKAEEQRSITHASQEVLREGLADLVAALVAGSAMRTQIPRDTKVDNMVEQCFGATPRGCITMQGEADALKRSRRRVGEDFQVLASATHFSTVAFVESVASHVMHAIDTGRFLPVAAIESEQYDETPLPVRAPERA